MVKVLASFQRKSNLKFHLHSVSNPNALDNNLGLQQERPRIRLCLGGPRNHKTLGGNRRSLEVGSPHQGFRRKVSSPTQCKEMSLL